MVKWFRLVFLVPLCLLVSLSQGHAFSGQVGSLNPRLKSILFRIENHFHRPLSVTSGCRSRQHNHRIGGARESWHLRCMAADFKIEGVNKYTAAHYVASLGDRGGIGTYCSDGSMHVDLGPRREWNWCGGRRSFHQGLIRHFTEFRFVSHHHGHRKHLKKYRQRKHHKRHHRLHRRWH